MVQMLDPLEILGARTADHAVDFVILPQQKFRQVGSILAGDSGD